MKKLSGFSLIEMLLVLVIIGSFIYMGTNYIQQRTVQARIDKSVMDMQQILNAGMSYYIANGQWPNRAGAYAGTFTRVDQSLSATDPYAIFREGYLPKASIVNNMPSPWPTVPGGGFITPGYSTIAYDPGTNNQTLFYVAMAVQTASNASTKAYASAIASRLPLGYVSGHNASIANDSVLPPQTNNCTGTKCYVVAGVNIPGQNLNNATAVNFVGLFHHGACIPVPQCPVDANGNTMTPQVFVVPVSLSGVNNPNDNQTVYPISSFSAYTTGGASSLTPPYCQNQDTTAFPGTNQCDLTGMNNGAPANGYWRACVRVVTEKGDVGFQRKGTENVKWGITATVAAYTRCAPANETAGSTFQVYGD